MNVELKLAMKLIIMEVVNDRHRVRERRETKRNKGDKGEENVLEEKRASNQKK